MASLNFDAVLGMVQGRCLADIYYRLGQDPSLEGSESLYRDVRSGNMKEFWQIYQLLTRGDNRNSGPDNDYPREATPQPLASYGLLVTEATGDRSVWLEELHRHYSDRLLDDATKIYAYHLSALCMGSVPKTQIAVERLKFPDHRTYQGPPGLIAVVKTIAFCLTALTNTRPNFLRLLRSAMNAPSVRAMDPEYSVWLVGAVGAVLGAQVKASGMEADPEIQERLAKLRSLGGVNLPAMVEKLVPISHLQTTASQALDWEHIDVPPPIGFRFAIANLICGRFAGSYKQFLSGAAMCSSISNKISNSMIRVAATRIFADPYQSIVELPVNSIDSYRRLHALEAGKAPPPSVGKFGMGFFSFLYWLIGHPDRYVQIRSVPRIGTAYDLQIREIDGNLTGIFVGGKDSLPKIGFGTNIRLVGQFTNADMDQFKRQINRLNFVKDITLASYTSGNSFDNTIEISIETTHLSVGDWAEGITVPVLLGSTLIPSISTKGLAGVAQPTPASFRDESGIVRGGSVNFGLVITVGDIVVTRIGTRGTYRVTLPINTPLPVSRDDVVIADPESETGQRLARAFWRIVEDSIVGTDVGSLSQFLGYLDEYKFYSGQPALLTIIDQTRRRIYQIPDLIIMPSQDVATIFKQEWPSTYITYLEDAPLSRTYRQVAKLLPSTPPIFKDVQVVPLRSYKSVPTDGGLPGYVFVNADDPNFRASIVATYPNAILRDYNDPDTTLPLDLYYVLGTGSTTDRDAVNINYFDEITLKELNVIRLDPVLIPGLTSLVSAIEAKICSFGPEIRILPTIEDGKDMWGVSRFNETQKVWPERDMDGATKKKIISIYYLCLVAIAEFQKYAENSEQVAEYISQLCRFMSDFKIIVGTYAYVNVIFSARNASGFSYYPKFNKSIDNAAILQDPHFKSQIRDSFFRSLSNNLNPDRSLKGYVISLMDTRLIPGFGFANLMNYISITFQEVDRSVITLLKDVMVTSETPFEANLVYGLLNRIKHAAIYYQPEVIRYIQLEMRHRYSQSFFDDWIRQPLTSQKRIDYETKYKTIFFNPMVLAIKIFVSTLGQGGSGGPAPQSPPIPGTGYHFTANQLVDYVFWSKTEAVTNRGQLLNLMRMAEKHQLHSQVGRPQFQSVSIAVNEGTTKPFIPSVLTELGQNSVDAIRAALARGESPVEYIDIDFVPGILSFRDYIGIPDAALLSLWIAFLSSKTSEELISTGEMGTGFFNVYRQPWSRKVEIITSDLYIQARPVVEQDRVVDIDYQVSTTSEVFQGTQINIHLRAMSREELIAFMVDLNVFINSSLSFLPYPVRFNGRVIHAQRQLIYQTDVGSVYTVTSNNAPSILLTNGIPMGELIPYLTAMFGGAVTNYDLYMNIVVDLNKTYYLPVQSRNRLAKHQDKNLELVLKKFVSNGLFRFILYKIWSEKHYVTMEYYIPGITSRAPISQLMPYRGGSKDFITSRIKFSLLNIHFEGVVARLTLPQYISLLGTWMVTDTLSNTPETIDFRLDSLGIPGSELAFRGLIHMWFAGKRISSQTGPGAGQLPKPISPGISQAHRQAAETGKFLNLFAQVYYKIGASLGFDPAVVNFQRPAPLIEFVDQIPGMGVLAHYIPGAHKIEISFEMFTGPKQQAFNQSWDRFLNIYRSKGLEAAIVHFRISGPLKELIGNINPSSLVIHELQHALYNSDHAAKDNPHGFRSIVYEGKTQNLEFDQATNLVYTAILANGFWQEVLGAI